MTETESTGRRVLNFLGITQEGQTGELFSKLFRQKEDSFQAIHTVDATSYEADAPKISNALQDYLPVILNLSTVPPAEARRLIDFSAGAAMVVGGTIRRVSRGVFIIVPPNIIVDDEDYSDTNSNVV
jgi:FtsZ-interacting cell division protein YlmF